MIGSSILIVEDEPAVRGSMEDVLRQRGARVQTVSDGLEARALLKNKRFDLILADLAMPGMSGMELLSWMRKADIETQLILISGESDATSSQEGPWHRPYATLKKPYTPEGLEGIIMNALADATLPAGSGGTFDSSALHGFLSARGNGEQSVLLIIIHGHIPSPEIHEASCSLISLVQKCLDEFRIDPSRYHLGPYETVCSAILVLSDDRDLQSSYFLAQQLIDRIGQLSEEQYGNRLHSSVGFSSSHDTTRCPDTLLRLAREGLQKAVLMGPGSIERGLESGGRLVRTNRNTETLNRLRSALEKGQFRSVFQPKVDILSRKIVGLEALIRLDDGLGNLGPGEFIPIAEQEGLIEAITYWALRDIAMHLDRRSQSFPSLPISVNVSSCVLASEGFAQRLHAQLGPHLPQIEVEITETAVLSETSTVFDNLTYLREKGVEISLDDFGTGYSSLHHLRYLPLTKIKVDRSFIAAIEWDERSRAILTCMINLAMHLGLDIVAEGVETKSQLQVVRECGVRIVQGYLFSPPIPMQEISSVARRLSGTMDSTGSLPGI